MNVVRVKLVFEVVLEDDTAMGVPKSLEELSWFQTIVAGLHARNGFERGGIIQVFPGHRDLRWIGQVYESTLPNSGAGQEKP